MTKKGKSESSSPHEKDNSLEKKIIENLVELQKVQTNLSEKFDKLTEQLTSLLGLFEMAARSFAENPENKIAEKDKEFLDKVDRLLDQNKTIAKGLTLVEERIRERMSGGRPTITRMPREEESEDIVSSTQTSGRPLPRF
ncbi:hypothetical protein COU54_05850 [Candidatus Pacearchaeota archaeon CG10_big_fil_rev_8_21_14_0_10_31_24]|nr:MAG: hypothetical protein COU54_05850 [Candidatus Pacearchaeota archaeon CG10_big_fil_rev_8_21_14_0_10_31_24]